MPAESRFLPAVGMTTTLGGNESKSVQVQRLSFRSGVAARNLLFASCGSDAGRKQIPPCGRNDNHAWRQRVKVGPSTTFVIPQRRSREESAVRKLRIRCRRKTDSSLRSE